MTRKEEIHEIANTIDPNIGKEIDEDYNCADVYDFTIGFECGAKFIKEKMIDKICKFLEEHTYSNCDGIRFKLSEEYVENVIRKYLEE
jgi:hypothetical protein